MATGGYEEFEWLTAPNLFSHQYTLGCMYSCIQQQLSCMFVIHIVVVQIPARVVHVHSKQTGFHQRTVIRSAILAVGD